MSDEKEKVIDLDKHRERKEKEKEEKRFKKFHKEVVERLKRQGYLKEDDE